MKSLLTSILYVRAFVGSLCPIPCLSNEAHDIYHVSDSVSFRAPSISPQSPMDVFVLSIGPMISLADERLFWATKTRDRYLEFLQTVGVDRPADKLFVIGVFQEVVAARSM